MLGGYTATLEVAWVFDKGRMFGREGPPQHLSCVIGPAFREVTRTSSELTAAAESTLRRSFPAMAGVAVIRSVPLRERKASFAWDPESEPLRPATTTPIQGLFLAGDWTRTGLPPTIEGAVRSGFAAAAVAGSWG